jgi:sugar phosphate isomerase/epimerase
MPAAQSHSRRSFLALSAATLGVTAGSGALLNTPMASAAGTAAPSIPRFGLVTYQWGKDMDLATVIASCQKAGLPGVELRTQHKHAVEPELNMVQRQEVKKQFEGSGVELIGYGSNAQFHEDNPAKVKENIELAKKYIQLMHDCGGSGVKIKPNGFVKGVPHEKTIEQIGKALNEIGAYGQQYGQQIRVEVHGSGTSELPNIRAMMDIADHPNVAVCWNSNNTDLNGEGLAHNFQLVCHRLGKTTHVRELTNGDYPYEELFRMFLNVNYQGWILLEAHSNPDDKVAALIEQRKTYESLMQKAAQPKA